MMNAAALGEGTAAGGLQHTSRSTRSPRFKLTLRDPSIELLTRLGVWRRMGCDVALWRDLRHG